MVDKTNLVQYEYKDDSEKTTDFVKGLGLGFLILLAMIVISTISLLLLDEYAASEVAPVSVIILALGQIIGVILIINRFFKTRRYIAIGMLSLLIIPLLILGTCGLMLAGAGW